MRPFKFRAWDKDKKEMVYSHPSYIFDKYHDGGAVMQFTGLLDKNVTRIYEEDVVKFDNKIWWVQWVLSQWTYQRGDDAVIWIDEHARDTEVIGNIWENPELLEGKNGD